MSNYFPDRQHVEEIRRALWSGRPFGRAAVMVGAGMSRNAEPRGLARRSMPLWSELVGAIIDRLYPPGGASPKLRDRARVQVGAVSGFLRLAEEFAAAFGRPALDDLIFQATPDEDFVPGPLH